MRKFLSIAAAALMASVASARTVMIGDRYVVCVGREGGTMASTTTATTLVSFSVVCGDTHANRTELDSIESTWLDNPPLYRTHTHNKHTSMFAGGSKVNQWLQEWAGHEIENKAIVVRCAVVVVFD